jgi:hypothetical protein
MDNIIVSVYNVIDGNDLSEILVDKIPNAGDPIEINKELYFVCETDVSHSEFNLVVGVIPLVVRDPVKVKNIKEYLNCLSLAHRRVQFTKDKKICDFYSCDEMTIS